MPEEVVRNTSFSGGIAMKYQFIHSFVKQEHLLEAMHNGKSLDQSDIWLRES